MIISRLSDAKSRATKILAEEQAMRRYVPGDIRMILEFVKDLNLGDLVDEYSDDLQWREHGQ